MRALHTSRTIASSERGAALVMTLLVLVVLTAFGMTLVALGTSEVAMSSNWRDYSKDFYAAEAALESGVVGLRNLLPATPAPTQAQLNTIATPPTLSDARLTFGAYTITAASPAPNRQTFATGPYSGLFGWVQGYSIQAQVNGQGGTKAKLTQVLQHTRVPLFQFGIFYGKGVDLELRPGPGMTFNGKIFSNSNIYVAAGSTLQITDSMKAAGNIYRSIKSEPAYPNMSNPQIADAAGTLQTLNFDHAYQPGFGATWPSAGAWASQAMQTFGGQVQDSAMGVQQIVPPLPDLFGNPTNPDVVAHQLIEMPQAGDSPALASAKMYSQAGLRIVADATTITATGQNGNGVTLPANAVIKRTFYDAREAKTMTAYDVDVNLMRTAGALPANGVVYVAGTNTAANPVVRLVNGSQLPSGGLTFVSQNPVYIVGDYNPVPGGATHAPAARHADGRHHDEGILVPVVRSWAPTNDRGMTLPEVVIAVAILTIGLLAVVGMLSSGFSNVVIGGGESKATSYARQKLEELKNRCYCDATAFPASTGTDTPEAGVTRSWTVTQAGATTAPNRLSQITVTATWTSGSSATGGQQVVLQTMRAE